MDDKTTSKLKSIIAPTIEERKRRVDSFKAVAGYLVVAIIEIIVLFVVPLISGGITADDFGYYLPKSTGGWIIFWAIRAGTVTGNIAVYALFKAQAKMNVKHDPNYIKANELLHGLNGQKGFIPLSPRQKQVKDWTTKGIMMFLTTAGESIVIGSLLINFDMTTFISCIVSSITAILFGIVQMIKDEVYWTEDYLLYAEYITKLHKESTETQPEPIKTVTETNVSEPVEELSKDVEKEAESA